MSKLSEMIESLCPDGVEYVKLGEVCEMKRGTPITKKEIEDGDIPVVAGGVKPAYYCNKSNRDGDIITVAGSGANAGFVAYWDKPIYASDSFTVAGNDKIITKYIYYFLTSIQNKIYATKTGGGVPHVHISYIENFEIPLPPLPIQQEIVRILDTFTQLQTELQTELQLRKKQYNYYREHLLTFPEEVERKNICEICELRNGYTPSKANKAFWENGTIPWFRMEDIRQNGRILSDSIQHITPEAVKGKGLFKANSIILATTATIGEHALIIADSLANQQFTNINIRESHSHLLDVKFFYHYMFVIDQWCKANTNLSGFCSVDMTKFKKLEIPLPPMERQKEIASILDKFEALTTSLTEGIPAEIELRRKQYNFYREKLLTFRPKQ